MNIVCIPPQKFAKSQKYKKSNNIYENEIRKKLPLENVLKNIPAKFGEDQSILRQKKIGDDELDRHRHTGWFIVP